MIYDYRIILLMKTACILNYERYLNTPFEMQQTMNELNAFAVVFFRVFLAVFTRSFSHELQSSLGYV
jgi:hypothetical protein